MGVYCVRHWAIIVFGTYHWCTVFACCHWNPEDSVGLDCWLGILWFKYYCFHELQSASSNESQLMLTCSSFPPIPSCLTRTRDRREDEPKHCPAGSRERLIW